MGLKKDKKKAQQEAKEMIASAEKHYIYLRKIEKNK